MCVCVSPMHCRSTGRRTGGWRRGGGRRQSGLCGGGARGNKDAHPAPPRNENLLQANNTHKIEKRRRRSSQKPKTVWEGGESPMPRCVAVPPPLTTPPPAPRPAPLPHSSFIYVRASPNTSKGTQTHRQRPRRGYRHTSAVSSAQPDALGRPTCPVQSAPPRSRWRRGGRCSRAAVAGKGRGRGAAGTSARCAPCCVAHSASGPSVLAFAAAYSQPSPPALEG